MELRRKTSVMETSDTFVFLPSLKACVRYFLKNHYTSDLITCMTLQ